MNRPWPCLVLLVAAAPPLAPTTDKEPTYLGRPLSYWTERLTGNDASARLQAQAAFTTLRGKARPAVPALVKALASKDPNVRFAVMSALSSIGPEAAEAVPALVNLLADPASQATASATLAVIGEPAIKPLTEALASETIARRLGAAQALARLGPKAKGSAEALRKLAGKDPDPGVRVAALSALTFVAPRAKENIPVFLSALKDKGPNIQATASAQLVLAGKEVVPELARVLRSEDALTRQWSAYTLGHLGAQAQEARPDLEKALADDREAEVRRWVVYALQGLGAKESLAALIKALKDPDPLVRVAAAVAVRAADTKNQEALKVVLAEVQGKAPAERAAAVAALGGMGGGGKEGFERLVKALEDSDAVVRASAAGALGRLDTLASPAVPSLGKHLQEDKELLVRRACVQALAALGPTAGKAAPELVGALTDKDPTVSNWAAQALGRLALTTPAPLVEALGSKDLTVRQRMLGVVRNAARTLALSDKVKGVYAEALKMRLIDTDATVRRQAALALVEMDQLSAEVLPILVEVLRNARGGRELPFLRGDEQVAAEALRQFGPRARAAVPLLKDIVEDVKSPSREQAAHVLAAIGPGALEALPALVGALKADSPGLRRAAAEALGALGPAGKKAARPLAALLADPDRRVRLEAVWALGQLGAGAGEVVKDLGGLIDKDDRGLAPEAIRSLGEVGKEGVPELARHLGDADDQKRALILRALADDGELAREALPQIRKQLDASELGVRLEAARCLLLVGKDVKSALPVLKEALKADDRSVRLDAIRTLGLLGPEGRDSIGALIEILKGDDGYARQAAATALGRMGKEAAAPLAGALESDNPAVRRSAALALGRLGPQAKEVLPAVKERAAKEDSGPVRAALEEAVRQIEKK